MNVENDVMSVEKLETDEEISLRPQRLDEYIGQSSLKSNLEVYIQAAKCRLLFISPSNFIKNCILKKIV